MLVLTRTMSATTFEFFFSGISNTNDRDIKVSFYASQRIVPINEYFSLLYFCLLDTSDGADDLLGVSLGDRRVMTKKNN